MDKDAELDHIKNSPKFSVCDRVTYADINLRHYSGIVTSIGQTKNGGNCLVQWSQFPFVSEECMFNLARKS